MLGRFKRRGGRASRGKRAGSPIADAHGQRARLGRRAPHRGPCAGNVEGRDMSDTDDDAAAPFARDFPPPSGISEAARQALLAPRPPRGRYPELEDKDGWRRLVASRDRASAAASGAYASKLKVDVEARSMGGVPVYVATPRGDR